MKKLYLPCYDVFGKQIEKPRIIKIERHPKGFIKTAIKLYLETGENAVYPNLETAKRNIERR